MIVKRSFKEVGASWAQLNGVHVSYASKDEIVFLRRYGLEPTIFNVGCLHKYGYVYLTPHYETVVRDHGALDECLEAIE